MRYSGLILVVACGCTTNAASDDTELGGVYEITSHVRNEAGCTGGDAVAGEPGFAVVAMREAFGDTRMTLELCADPDTCRALAMTSASLGAQFFPRGSDSEGWMGEGAAASVTEGTCNATHITSVLTGAAGASIELTIREADVMYPAEADECPLAATAAAAAGMCTRIETIQATFDSAL